jgi:hypothetical protein
MHITKYTPDDLLVQIYISPKFSISKHENTILVHTIATYCFNGYYTCTFTSFVKWGRPNLCIIDMHMACFYFIYLQR